MKNQSRGIKICHHFNFLFTLLLQILDDDLSLGVHQHKSVFKTNCTNGIAKTIYFIQITSGQSYKASMIVIYDSRVVPDWKIPHITTLES